MRIRQDGEAQNKNNKTESVPSYEIPSPMIQSKINHQLLSATANTRR